MRPSLKRFKFRMTKPPTRRAVTLVIYGWHESQPGTLAWVFPSLHDALRAVRALRNAVHWLILKGQRFFEGEVDVAALRRTERVLRECGVT